MAEAEAEDMIAVAKGAAALCGGSINGAGNPGPWPACAWQVNGKRSAAVRYIQDQAVAHERRALQILRQYYGQADCDLLYYDAVRDAESF